MSFFASYAFIKVFMIILVSSVLRICDLYVNVVTIFDVALQWLENSTL